MSDDVLFAGLRGTLDHCVKCTICETACPVSAVTPLFPGPKYAGPQSERFRAGREPSPDASVDYCSGCGICSQVCPHDVAIAELNARARAAIRERDGVSVRDRLIARPTVLGRLGTPVAPLANRSLRSRPLRYAAEKLIGIDRHAPLPSFAGRTFRRWARRHVSPPGTRHAVFFHGCGTQYYEPELGELAVAVLEHNEFEVTIPDQDCCGLPLQSNGLFDDARGYLGRLAARLDGSLEDGAVIVGHATSCTLMLKREGREILGLEDDARLARVAGRTYDICELLLDLHHAGELRTDLAPVDATVIYHAPCQLKGHWMGSPALELLALVPGLTVVESTAGCCGIAGTYGLKTEKHAIAQAVGAELFAQVRDSGAATVACDSETCRWQITHATGRESVHPIALLHRAYRL